MRTFRILVSVLLLTVALPVFAQSPGFEAKYKIAKEQFDNGQYDKAKTTIRKALSNSPGITAAQRNKGQALVKDCDDAIAILNECHPLRGSVDFAYTGGQDSISCVAGQPKLLTATSEDPNVCKVERVEGSTIYIQGLFNPDKAPRRTRIVIRMGSKAETQYVDITQSARPETRKYLEFATVPSHANVSIDGGNPGSSPVGMSVEAGTHRIHIEKNGYAMKDTTIVIADDNVEENIHITTRLRPNFATVSVNLLPEEGFSFGDELPVLRLNGQSINLSGRDILSYDDDSFLHRYEVYQDGTIPVPFGDVDVYASAPKFETARYNCRLKEGQHENITLVLKAVKGVLQLVDAGKARDAMVVLDGQEVGTVEQLDRYVIGIGEHSLQLSKEGHIAEQSSYSFVIKENEMTTLPVAMIPFQVFAFTSTPKDALVYINGEYFGSTPTVPVAIKETEVRDGLQIDIRKDGFMPSRRQLTPDFERRDTLVEHFALTKVSSLNVTTDDKNLYLVVKTSKRDKSADSTLVNRLQLPTQINLPVRKKPYYVELRRGGTDAVAYRGKLKFNRESKRRHHIQSWSRNNFHLISADLFVPAPMVGLEAPFGPQPFIFGKNEVVFQPVGNASLFKFRLFPGFSTSVLHANMMLQEHLFKGEVAQDVKVPKQNGDLVSTAQPGGILPGFTVLFLNDELRLGGAICDYMDVDLVGSYAWYPDVLKTIVPLSHFTGHEVFAGLELASRLPFLNITLKAGYQMYFNAKANFYSAELASGETKNKFYTYDLNIPGQIVFGVGISLGGRDSKGDSIIRLF